MSQHSSSATPSIARGVLAGLVIMVLLLCFAGLAILTFDVRRAVVAQATASSDNTQWTLSQVDVEYLSLKDAVMAAKIDRGSIAEVRKRFDIIYSRSTTLTESYVFTVLRKDKEFSDGVKALHDFLDKTVPLIDGSDDVLMAALPDLERQIQILRPDVKKIAMAGIRVFAIIADSEREKMANTLIAVGALTLLMIVFLVGLVAMLLRFDFINRSRSHELMLTLARSESIVDTALDAVIVIDFHGRVIAFNPASEKIFGYVSADVIGIDMAELIIPPSTRALHDAGMRRMQAGGKSVMAGRGRIRMVAMRRGGEEFPIEMSVAQSEDNTGTIFIAYLRDLSAEVAAEKELLKARDDALAGEKAKADLLAVMSHEMRTPLNGMLGMLELLQDSDLTPRQIEFLNVMQSSGRLLLRHVNDVLSMARLESGKMPVQQTVIDLEALVQEIFSNQAAAAAQNGNQLQYKMLLPGPKQVISDVFQVRQVLLNLIGNAIKFTSNGMITVETAYSFDDGVIEFRVIDTGIGIPAADLERVFDDFVTLDATYARAADGTGLGLAITRRIVDNLGGTIVAESDFGHGSLFRVRIPMQAAPLGATPHDLGTLAALPNRIAARPLSVLVVEDNPVNRLVVREMLAKLGHRVDEANDGEDGVRQAGETRYDVILMDISMPRLDGVAATLAIRQGQGASRATPIVALTAHALAAEVARFKAAGMQDVLVKPVTGSALAKALFAAVVHLETGQAVAQDAQIAEDLLNAETIEELFDTMGGDRARKLLRRFLEQAQDSLENLLQPKWQSETAEALRSEIHKLCGSAAMFGARKLNLRLRALEELCKAGDAAPVIAQLPSVMPIWQATRAALVTYLVEGAEKA